MFREIRETSELKDKRKGFMNIKPSDVKKGGLKLKDLQRGPFLDNLFEETVEAAKNPAPFINNFLD